MPKPEPGGIICQACGAVGSPAYLACNAAVSVGQIPSCAGPGNQAKGGSVAAQNNQPTAAPATSSSNIPWFCYFLGNITAENACAALANGTTTQNPQLPTINWQDIGIRTGLVVIGAVVLFIAVARLVHQPDVVVEEKE